jgi:ETFB lysine methyltransferase
MTASRTAVPLAAAWSRLPERFFLSSRPSQPQGAGAPESFLPPGYEFCRRTVRLPGWLEVKLFLVADPNALSDQLDEGSFGTDERFPYWAELWPSALALSAFLARRGVPPDTEVLELGCGSGLVGVVAALLGGRVTFTDFEADALAAARANHALNLGPPGRTALFDWRSPPPGLSAPLVLAADVLYERRFLDPFVRSLRSVVTPGGVAYVAEPGRRVAEGTLEGLEREGFERELHLEEVELHGLQHGVWIHELRAPAPQ